MAQTIALAGGQSSWTQSINPCMQCPVPAHFCIPNFPLSSLLLILKSVQFSSSHLLGLVLTPLRVFLYLPINLSILHHQSSISKHFSTRSHNF